MEGRIENKNRCGISDEALGFVLMHIHDPRDRDAVSLVCRRWYEMEGQTRKGVTIALCYTTTPDRLRRRFQHIESLKLKGKPRAAMFNLIPEDWGGYVTPWVNEISMAFVCLKSIHFRRMIVRDSDLEVLARSHGRLLHSLKLDKCSGFSTDGLLHVARSCRNLTTLFLEESSIIDNDGEWLHHLALNNTVLEVLNFYMTELENFNFEDLVLIARHCPFLVSVKISDCELADLIGFFHAAHTLEEFCGGSVNTLELPHVQPQEQLPAQPPEQPPEKYSAVSFPPRLCHLGLTFLSTAEMPIIFPITSMLKKLDLLCACLNTDDHCLLIPRCPNLEVLETRNVIGDRGLEVLAQSCKKLRRLRIERGADEQGIEDEGGVVSQRGLIALAQGCLELEYMAVYVSDITNESLEHIGTYSKNLRDFRLVLLDKEKKITDLPLDEGVRALLRGCEKLRRFALYLRPGGLSDVGLGYLGQYSSNVKWMLLGSVGESDAGLLQFSRGCPSLQKLEMRGCCFSEHALARAIMQLTSLRYLWVHGYRGSLTGRDLLAMTRPYLNIELIIPRQAGHTAHILAYYSLAGQRTDFPDSVMPLRLDTSSVTW